MDEEKIIEELMSGKTKPYNISKAAGGEKNAAKLRRKYLEKKYKSKLDKVGNTVVDFEDAENRNVELSIGSAQVPLGFAEIMITGEYVKNKGDEKSVVFLATTEGKLVASVNRGAAAINKSGGVRTKVLRALMTRSILLECESVSDSSRIMGFVRSGEGEKYLKNEFSKHTKHGQLDHVDTYTTGRLLFIVYNVDTKAAMGMNMVTIGSTNATKALVEKLKAEGLKAKILSESGNMCVDKKPAMINIIRGRGISIVAEAVIKKEVISEYFRASAESIRDLNYAKNYMGSSLAGSLAHNAQVANVLAATFIAYGQDPAQIVDGVNTFDDVKVMPNGDLYISVYIPALEVGTYGGGTRRETQQELLRCSGVYGEGDSKGVTKLKLAEIIAAAVLAGELNLLAAQAGMELSRSHSEVKRG
jgi:hydroxymethylglutaryl-CoA reductase (NADPH)